MHEELDRELLLKNSSMVLSSVKDNSIIDDLPLNQFKKNESKPKKKLPPKKKALTKKQRAELEADINYNADYIRAEMREILEQARKIEVELIELKERGNIVKEFVDEEVDVYQKYKEPI